MQFNFNFNFVTCHLYGDKEYILIPLTAVFFADNKCILKMLCYLFISNISQSNESNFVLTDKMETNDTINFKEDVEPVMQLMHTNVHTLVFQY